MDETLATERRRLLVTVKSSKIACGLKESRKFSKICLYILDIYTAIEYSHQKSRIGDKNVIFNFLGKFIFIIYIVLGKVKHIFNNLNFD